MSRLRIANRSPWLDLSAGLRKAETQLPGRLRSGAIVGALCLPLFALAGLAVAEGYGFFLATALAIGAALVIGISNWRWSLYGLVLYMPFSGIPIVLTFPDTGYAVLIKDFLFIIPLYCGFFAEVLQSRRTLTFNGAPVSILAIFVLVVILEAFNPLLPSPQVALIGFRAWIFYLPMLFVGYHFVRTKQDLWCLFAALTVPSLVPALVGILEALLVQSGNSALVYGFYGKAATASLRFAQYSLAGEAEVRRNPSLFATSAQYFGLLSINVPVAYAWWRGALAQTRFNVLGGGMVFFFTVAVLLSGQRASYIFVPITVLCLLVFEGLRGKLSFSSAILPLAGLAAGFVILGAAFSPVYGYIADLVAKQLNDVFINGFRQTISTNPLGAGTGISSAGVHHLFESQQALLAAITVARFDSWWVTAAVELGLAGLILVVALMWSLTAGALRRHATLRDPRLIPVSAALISIVIWTCVISAKGEPLEFDPVNVYFWLLMGVLAKVAILDRHEEPSTRETAD